MSLFFSDPQEKRFSLRDLLQEQSRDLYDAEIAHRSILQTLNQASLSSELGQYLWKIGDECASNIVSLEAICKILDVPPTGVKCAAMEGLVREAKEASLEWESSTVRDAALIASEQRIVHYQIAGFGTARAFAKILKLNEVATHYQKMLQVAQQNDKALTHIACGNWLESGINQIAADSHA